MIVGDDALFLGIDCSTTACKAIAWDRAGRAVAEGRAPIPLSNPAPDAWEQDARGWWDAMVVATRAAARALGDEGARRIRAVTITHQRETFVLTDERGEPLHPALVWMDARCRAEVEGHREVASMLGNSGADAPEGVWDRIASQLEDTPPPMAPADSIIWNITKGNTSAMPAKAGEPKRPT